MIVICGLGNPGNKYNGTRHNVGFDFINKFKIKYEFKIKKKDNLKEIYEGSINNKKYYLIKPLTYVNLSGKAVISFLNYYKSSINKLTVVHDDIDLKVGKIKLKLGGNNGGHNGLQSIDEIVGNSYNRIRIGIGHPGSKEFVSKYVLQKFNKDEKKIINNIVESSINHINLLFSDKALFLNKISSLKNKDIFNGV